MSDKFEYVVLSRESLYDDEKKAFDHQALENRLNELGQNGYRIIKVISDPVGSDWMIILSKSSFYRAHYQGGSRNKSGRRQ
jgi:hypothetical protein